MTSDIPPELYGRKVSEVFNDFAQPVLRALLEEGHWHDIAKHEVAVRIPWTIWNAVVMADDCGDDKFISMYCDIAAKLPRQFRPLAQEFFDLKRGPFKKYKFLFGDVKVYAGSDGEPRMRVEAKALPKRAAGPR